jgi:hypothetical protein
MVVLSIVPARTMPAAALWTASKASLLYLRGLVIANLHQLFGFQFLANLNIGLRSVEIGQFAKRLQFVILDISPVLLRKEVGVNSVAPPPGENDAPAPVLIQALFEHASAEVVGLALSHFHDGVAKLVVADERLARRFGEPSGLEGPRGFLSISHDLM